MFECPQSRGRQMFSRYREESPGASIVLDSEHVYTHFCGVPLEPDDHICIHLREGSVHKNTVSPRSLTHFGMP